MYPFPAAMMLGNQHTFPQWAVVGDPVSISLTKAGRTLTVAGAGDEAFVYLDRPMTAPNVYYWEFEILSDWVLPGVTDNPETAANFGGYPNTNAGLYSANGALWRESGWGGAWSAGSLGALAAGTNIGFGYFGPQGRLVVRIDGVEVSEITFSSPPAQLYAHAGFQSTGSGRFRLGPGGCVYPKIPGTNHL